MVDGRWKRSSASGSSLNFLTTLTLTARMKVRMRTFGSILRTTSSLMGSSTFDRIVAVQMLSWPTFVVGKRNAAARDASTELLSRMLSAVERQAFGELADLAGANAAEKRAVACSRLIGGLLRWASAVCC